jgi:hypothetical protein
VASPVLHLVHCRTPEQLRCEIIKGGLIDGIPSFVCDAPAEFRSLLDGWCMCCSCAESMPYLWPERMN